MLGERDLGETQVLAAFIGISEMVGSLTELEEVLKTVVRVAPQLVRVDRCAIFLYDPEGKSCRPAEAYSPRPALADVIMERKLFEDEVPKLFNKVVHQKLPTVIRNLPQEDMLPLELIENWELNSMLVIPLVSKGQTQGIMTLDSTTSKHYFTSKEINIVTGIANQVAIAIENGKLQEESQRAFGKIETVAEQLSDAVLRVDGRMKVRGLSPQAGRFLGCKEEAIKGKRWTQVLKPKDFNGRTLEEMDFVGPGPMANGEMSVGKKAFIEKGEGGKVYCRIRALPIRGKGFQPSQLLFVFKKMPIPKKRGKRDSEEIGLEGALPQP